MFPIIFLRKESEVSLMQKHKRLNYKIRVFLADMAILSLNHKKIVFIMNVFVILSPEINFHFLWTVFLRFWNSFKIAEKSFIYCLHPVSGDASHLDTVVDVCMYEVKTRKVKEVTCWLLSLLLADNHSLDTNIDENPN